MPMYNPNKRIESYPQGFLTAIAEMLVWFKDLDQNNTQLGTFRVAPIWDKWSAADPKAKAMTEKNRWEAFRRTIKNQSVNPYQLLVHKASMHTAVAQVRPGEWQLVITCHCNDPTYLFEQSEQKRIDKLYNREL